MASVKKKVFVITGRVGTRHRLFVHGTGKPETVKAGRRILATAPKEIRFNRGTFVARSDVRYRLYDDLADDVILTQIEWLDQHPENVANNGRAFQAHEPWMDKADAARLLAVSAKTMSGPEVLKAINQIASMPEGRQPTAQQIQVHVGVRDAAIKGKTLDEVEPNYGDLEAVTGGRTPVSPKVAEVLRTAIVQEG